MIKSFSASKGYECTKLCISISFDQKPEKVLLGRKTTLYIFHEGSKYIYFQVWNKSFLNLYIHISRPTTIERYFQVWKTALYISIKQFLFLFEIIENLIYE